MRRYVIGLLLLATPVFGSLFRVPARQVEPETNNFDTITPVVYTSQYAGVTIPTNSVQAYLDGADNKFVVIEGDINSLQASNHAPVTVSDTSEVDLTITGQDLEADIVASSIDETKLDVSVNASLDLADSASQVGDNVSDFVNDAGYLTPSSGPIDSRAQTNNVNAAGYAYTNAAYIDADNVASLMGTGLIKGGHLSVNSTNSAQFDIAAGEGWVVDNYTDPANPVMTIVTWDTIEGIDPTGLGTLDTQFIFIDSTGSEVQTDTLPSEADKRDKIYLGKMLLSPTECTLGLTFPQVRYDVASQITDLTAAIGIINISGNVFTENSTNAMHLDKSIGSTYRLGANYSSSYKTPSTTSDAALEDLNFAYGSRDGAGGYNTSSLTNAVDPSLYDDGSGTLQVVGTKYTVQRVYYFTAGTVFVTYGQVLYNSLSAAIEGASSEQPSVNPQYDQDASLRAYLVMRGNVTALESSTSTILPGSKFNGTAGGSGGGSGDVVGPSGSVDDAIARFDGTTGKLIQDGANATCDDDGNLVVADVTATNVSVANGFKLNLEGPSGNTYLYRNSSAIRMFVDGVEPMRLDSDGDVGIGVSSAPTATLHIKQSEANLNGGVRLETSEATAEDWYLYMDASDDLTFQNDALVAMTVQKDTGNVGIGTDSPDNTLHIKGDEADNILTIEGGDNTVSDEIGISFKGPTYDKARIKAINNNGGNAAGELVFMTGGWPTTTSVSEAMRIDSSGNVGIGTTSPSEPLDVEVGANTAGIRIAGKADNSVEAQLEYVNGFGTALNMYDESAVLQAKIRSYGDSYFNGGNVGIKNASPSDFSAGGADDLVIGDGSTGAGATIYTGTGNYGVLNFADGTGAGDRNRGYVQYNQSDNSLQFGTDSAEAMRIDSNGNVGIGTNAPAAPLHVHGITRMQAATNLGTIATINEYRGFDLGDFHESGDAGRLRMYYVNARENDYIDLGGFYDGATFKMVRNTTQEVYLATGGDGYFNTGGNFGIGTNAPSGRNGLTGTTLEVNTTGDTFPMLLLSRDGGVTKSNQTWSAIVGSSGSFLCRDETVDTVPLSIEAGAPADSINVQSTGNVGIGTNGPANPNLSGRTVHLVSTGDTFPSYVLERSGGSTKTDRIWSTTVASDGAYTLRDETASANIISVETSGNVGLGTTSPNGRLHVDGDGTFTEPNFSVDDDTGRTIAISGEGMWRRDGAVDSDGIVVNRVGYNDGTTKFRDFTVMDGKGTEVLVVDGSAARVAIGKAVPNVALDIEGQINAGGTASNHEIKVTRTTTNPSEIAIQAYTANPSIDYSGSNGDLRFIYDGSTETMRLTSDGKLGIGTNGPSFNLHIRDTAPTLVLESDTGSDPSIGLYENGSVVGRLINDTSGNDLILENTLGVTGADTIIRGNDGIGLTIEKDGDAIFGGDVQVSGSFAADGATPNALYAADFGDASSSGELRVRTATANIPMVIIGVTDVANSDVTVRNISGDLVLTTSNSQQRVTVDGPTGNVGIGTNGPDQKLHLHEGVFQISKDAPTASALMLLTDTASASQRGAIQVDESASLIYLNALGNYALGLYDDSKNGITVKDGGNAGIGTDSPDVKLHVQGIGVSTTYDADDLITVENNDNSNINLASSTSGGLLMSDGTRARGGVIYTHSSDSMALRTAGSTQVTVDSSGNVGIGTSSAPVDRLQIETSSGDTFVRLDGDQTENNLRGIKFGHGKQGADVQQKAAILADATGLYGRSKGVHICLNNSNDNANAVIADAKLSVLEGGNVGIGTNAPSEKLVVHGNIKLDSTGTTILKLAQASSGGHEWALYQDGTHKLQIRDISASVSPIVIEPSAQDNMLYLADDGNVGIGTTTPGEALDVVGTITSSDQLCEQDFREDASQAFVNGSFTVVTNMMDHIVDANYTTTHSNITVTAAGRYTATMNLSFQSSTGAAQVECYLYTNNVAAVTAAGNNIGWDRTVSASASDGTIAATKTLDLPAGCIVDWRIETGASETLVWDHGTVRLERK